MLMSLKRQKVYGSRLGEMFGDNKTSGKIATKLYNDTLVLLTAVEIAWKENAVNKICKESYL